MLSYIWPFVLARTGLDGSCAWVWSTRHGELMSVPIALEVLLETDKAIERVWGGVEKNSKRAVDKISYYLWGYSGHSGH